MYIWRVTYKAPVKRTEHFTEQDWTFVECKMFRAFDHLVEPCSPFLSLVQWSLIAIKLFIEQMLSDSTFPLFFEMLSVVHCVWPANQHLFSSCVRSGWRLARNSALFSKMFSTLTTQQLNITKQHSTLLNKCSVLFSQNIQYVWPGLKFLQYQFCTNI